MKIVIGMYISMKNVNVFCLVNTRLIFIFIVMVARIIKINVVLLSKKGFI